MKKILMTGIVALTMATTVYATKCDSKIGGMKAHVDAMKVAKAVGAYSTEKNEGIALRNDTKYILKHCSKQLSKRGIREMEDFVKILNNRYNI